MPASDTGAPLKPTRVKRKHIPSVNRSIRPCTRSQSRLLRELSNGVQQCAVVLESLDQEWTARVASVQTLARLVSTFHISTHQMAARLKPMQSPLKVQLSDLRSAVIKEVCLAIGQIARNLGSSFEPLAEALLPSLIRLLGNAKIAMSGPAYQCLTLVVTCCAPLPSLDEILHTATDGRSSQCAAHCASIALAALTTWEHVDLQQNPLFLTSLPALVAHQSPLVRSHGRIAFSKCLEVFGVEKLAPIFARLSVRTQQGLLAEAPELRQTSFGRAVAKKARQPLGDRTNKQEKPWLAKGKGVKGKPWQASKGLRVVVGKPVGKPWRVSTAKRCKTAVIADAKENRTVPDPLKAGSEVNTMQVTTTQV